MKRPLLGITVTFLTATGAFAFVPGGTLPPTAVPKYVEQLIIPPAMPKSDTNVSGIDYYRIGVRQFEQQILPAPLPGTTVWGYGALEQSDTFHYPAFTIEAVVNRPVRVQWVNDLMAADGSYLPHLLPIDQTLHWANPPQDCMGGSRGTDCRGESPGPYQGPVPIVPHVHGAHVAPDSDGYPEAWFLPAATNIPAGYATTGSHYSQTAGAPQQAGQATYQYTNDQRATTLWYHDHALGITRANVYAGLAGFYLLRDPKSDPADLPKGKYEIPLAIQDRSFNEDGSLFLPDNRAFFEGVAPDQLDIPFIPEQASGGASDVSPIWNPEFFGNMMVVNGRTWPTLKVEAERYRMRLLNGCDSRALILKIAADKEARPGIPALPFWQIGADGGFLPKVEKVEELVLGPGERADVIIDFSKLPKGAKLYLINEGPDEPFGGGRAPVAFAFADPATTGQVMEFVVDEGPHYQKPQKPVFAINLPKLEKLGKADRTRTLSLNESESATVFVVSEDGTITYNPEHPEAVPFGPVAALLGTATVNSEGVIAPTPMEWMEEITENPLLGSTEIWEIYNFTEDAHPIHLHLVQFEVLNRQEIAPGADGTATLVGKPTPPEVGETGTKDTVLVYPGMVTRVKAKFDIAGLFVWHCHILSHEDNEMMRPMCIGPMSECHGM